MHPSFSASPGSTLGAARSCSGPGGTYLRAEALQRGGVEMLAVGRVARSAAGSKLACAVLVHMQEGSQKESRWQPWWTDDCTDTATTTCTGRHLPNWGRR